MKFTVPIDDCLQALHKNLDIHKSELKEATEVWTEQAIKALEELCDAVDRKGLAASYDKVGNLFSHRPIDNRANYSRYIGALELTQKGGEKTVTLDEDDYDSMFNDNWDWRSYGKTANAMYSRH